MNRDQETQTVFALWQRCRDFFASLSAPSVWFDPQPNWWVQQNVRRTCGACRQRTGSCPRRAKQQWGA